MGNPIREDLATTYKRQAAQAALPFIQSGMIVDLGHGTTAIWAVRGLAEQIAHGTFTDILGVPCSRQVEAEARRLGIPLKP